MKYINKFGNFKSFVKYVLFASVSSMFIACSSGGGDPQPSNSTILDVIDGRTVVISSPSFSLNESSIVNVGTISVLGLPSESVVLLSANILTGAAAPTVELVGVNNGPCYVTESHPSCAVKVTGNNAINGNYDYQVTYFPLISPPVIVNKPIPITINSALSPVRSGGLSISMLNMVNSGASTTATITLNDSIGISPITVNIESHDIPVSLSSNTCTLSPESNYCVINVTAQDFYSDNFMPAFGSITAGATNYVTVESNLMVLPKVAGQLNIYPYFGGGTTLSVGTSNFPVVVELSGSALIESVTVTMSASNDGLEYFFPNTCILSSNNQRCVVYVDVTNSDSSRGPVNAVASATNYESAALPFTIYQIRRMFVSESSPAGNMFKTIAPYTALSNGVARADKICEVNAANYASSVSPSESYNFHGIWKAMIVDSTTRQAMPESKDWVLNNYTEYYDSVTRYPIGMTGSNFIFTSDLYTTFGYSPGYGYNWSSYANVLLLWTGLNKDWSVNPYLTCNNWDNNTASYDGAVGNPVNGGTNNLESAAWSGAYLSCDRSSTASSMTTRLLCVQQN